MDIYSQYICNAISVFTVHWAGCSMFNSSFNRPSDLTKNSLSQLQKPVTAKYQNIHRPSESSCSFCLVLTTITVCQQISIRISHT